MSGDRGLGPVMGAVALIGAALMLAGGLYAAHTLGPDGQGKSSSPDVGLWADDANDRLNVVSGDPNADWDDVTLESDVPVRYSLGGILWSSAVRPGEPQPIAKQGITGGQYLQLCAVEGDSLAVVTLRDAANGKVLFQEDMHLGLCLERAAETDPDLDLP